ncbi:MAG: hypothetical protein L3J88_03860 [Gammaproteobacteria bacterium]|nr:hypothetical protein [Gammaproteobacteria bacterium]MCF6362484.1 hypothetical protein [Gammaproteobacteria bacterium]
MRGLRGLMLMMAILCAASEALAVTASIIEVKSRHESRLLSLPGVISVGIGRASDGRTVIVIGVEDKASEEGPDLPRQLEGYPVRVDVIGPVRAQ